MIRITYSRDRQPLAEMIRDDLADTFQVSVPILIVLVSKQSNADPHVQAEIESARRERAHILPILTDSSARPVALAAARALDFSRGYERERLLQRLAQAAMTPADIRRANRRAFTLIAGIAALIFGIAVVAIVSGGVAFPVAEYNEEATFQAQWVDGLIRETLAHVQPHGTEDALRFAATYEAAPTRLHYYIRGTATALAKGSA
ncbi:MAG: TIR domain-containing protein [Chloroflexi bacterium]|nr:TIR domain-containing protein [Chloroflexota bacterium]